MVHNVTKRKDVIWGYLGAFFSMGTSLIILPFVLKKLEDSQLGLWYLFSSIGLFATIFDYTFSAAMARNFSYIWNGANELKKGSDIKAENEIVDWKMLKKVFLVNRGVYGIMSVSAFAIMGIVGTKYIIWVSRDLNGNFVFAWLGYLAGVCLNLYLGYLFAALRGVGALEVVNKCQVYSRGIQVGAVVILLHLDFGLYGVAIGYLVSIIVLGLTLYSAFMKYMDVGKKIHQVKILTDKQDILKIFSVIWSSSWKEAIVSISTYLCGQMVTLLSSLYYSLDETGFYALYLQLSNVVAQISLVPSGTFLPEMQAAYVTRNMERMRRKLSGTIVAFVLVYILGTIGILVFGMPLLLLFKKGIILDYRMMILAIILQFVMKFPYCYTAYFSATNRIIYYKSYFLSAIFSFFVSLVFLELQICGIYGVIVIQILGQLVYNFWIWIVRACKELHMSLSNTMVLGGEEIKSMALSRFKCG